MAGVYSKEVSLPAQNKLMRCACRLLEIRRLVIEPSAGGRGGLARGSSSHRERVIPVGLCGRHGPVKVWSTAAGAMRARLQRLSPQK